VNIIEATENFDVWLGKQLSAHGGLDPVAVQLKHQAMKNDGPHAFLRATFYRWVQLWQQNGLDGPGLLSVGDTHVENFGTWRDAGGRLVWGVNDFDEVCELPYTSDLVRLGVSARLATKELEDFETSANAACELILHGYTESVRHPTTPFILGENHPELTRLAQQTVLAASPDKFWNKKIKKTQPTETVPPAARKLLEASLPSGTTVIEFREPIPDDPPGLGSRGKRRFYALALWNGARELREGKPVVPSSCTWVSGSTSPPRITELLKSPNRCPDPSQQVRDGWIVRRLAPDAIKIELPDLAGKGATRREEEALFESMGAELGRLHAGAGEGKLIARNLDERISRDKEWFVTAVKVWATTVEGDQKEFALLSK
jgi:hypothetical protein